MGSAAKGLGSLGCIWCAILKHHGSYHKRFSNWNACFVYSESSKYFASSLCIILAAEIYPFLKGRPELYIMARVYTLATHLLIRSCCGDIFPALMDASSWRNDTFMKYWGMVNFALIVPYTFWYMWQLHTGKSEISFRRGRVKTLNSQASEMV